VLDELVLLWTTLQVLGGEDAASEAREVEQELIIKADTYDGLIASAIDEQRRSADQR